MFFIVKVRMWDGLEFLVMKNIVKAAAPLRSSYDGAERGIEYGWKCDSDCF
ncbi:hypothetical protein J2Z66_005055 [Paenibacillus eucommiae]|uniref:Uncharacterized protein n=1 Tax=Paenibacillus eucommiae TaxID=1355755 RepID=A0ABS4J0W0_9BACL|nr:hypothetical protein [Paenibacillus eucommiae]